MPDKRCRAYVVPIRLHGLYSGLSGPAASRLGRRHGTQTLDSDLPPLVPSPELNWNGTTYTGDNYRNYMSKNLYWLEAAVRSESNYESGKELSYVALVPSDFKTGEGRGLAHKNGRITITCTSNDSYFWANP